VLGAVSIGLEDLSAALGQALDVETKAFQFVLDKVLVGVKWAGNLAGFYGNNPSESKEKTTLDFQLVNICMDISIILQSFSKNLHDMKNV